MKNIAILIQALYGGGAERIAGLLSKKLSAHYKVYLFMVDTSNIVYEYDGEIVDLLLHGWPYVEYTAKLYKQKYEIDCAISFLEPMNFLNIRTRGKESIVISERCAQSPINPPHYRSTVNIKRLYNYADRIVAVAHGVKYDLAQNYGIKEDIITTIYNFINKEKIIENAKEKLNDEITSFIGESKIILNIGRLVKQKNQKKLLLQFARLRAEGENVKLIIVGKGELQKELEDYSNRLGIDEYVKIVDYNKNPFPLYCAADMLALTSDFEGLPNVILEAMLLGVPIVAVDCLSGPRELLKASVDYGKRVAGYEICECGVLVESSIDDETGKTEYFKEAMKMMLHDAAKRTAMIQNARRYMDSYRNEQILEQWIDVIENTVSRYSAPPEIIIPELKGRRKIIVYGCGNVGRQVMRQYIEQKEKLELLCFAVSDRTNVDEEVDGIPVFEIESLLEYKEDAIVLIGVSEKYEREVIDNLDIYGFQYVLPYLKPVELERK